MASIKFGMMVTEMAGTMGGSVVQRSRYGFAAMNAGRAPRVVSPALAARQSSFSLAAKSWRTLTEAERIQWRSIAGSITMLSRLNVSYTPSGFQLFIQCVLNVQTISPATVLAGIVAIPPPPLISAVAAVFSVGSLTAPITWVDGGSDAGWKFVPSIIGGGNGAVTRFPYSPLILNSTPLVSAQLATVVIWRVPRMVNADVVGNLITWGFRCVHLATGFASPFVTVVTPAVV